MAATDNPDGAAKPLLKAKDVAERTGLSERHIRHLVTERRIPFKRFGYRTVRFDPDAIDAWIEAATHEPIT